MDAQEDFLLSGAVKKGRRTKRQRAGHHVGMPPRHHHLEPVDSEDTLSASASASFSGSITEEDEDIANCLILLSQGDREDRDQVPSPDDPSSPEQATTSVSKFAATDPTVPQSYECKTCNKTFPSFQALGGHRASHKKPKLSPPARDDKKPAEEVAVADTALQMISSVNSMPTAMAAVGMSVIGRNSISSSVGGGAGAGAIKANKIHECSICGAEFNSGQALGGHMRRHRPTVVVANSAETTSSQEVMKKERSLLEFDLNLPAEDVTEEVVARGQQFIFEAAPEKPPVTQPLLFRSSLVDCHY